MVASFKPMRRSADAPPRCSIAANKRDKKGAGSNGSADGSVFRAWRAIPLTPAISRGSSRGFDIEEAPRDDWLAAHAAAEWVAGSGDVSVSPLPGRLNMR